MGRIIINVIFGLTQLNHKYFENLKYQIYRNRLKIKGYTKSIHDNGISKLL